jgi:hypothetical protein
MFPGSLVVASTSAKQTLVGALTLLAFYVGGYLVAALYPSIAWPSILFGASFGGVGAGLLWIAQGVYFKLSLGQYAKGQGVSEEEASGFFSSLFATLYLSFEVGLKLCGILVARFGPSSSTFAIFAVYSVIAVVSTLLMATIRDMRSSEDLLLKASLRTNCSNHLSASLRLLLSNPKCYLMFPTNAAFGFSAAFIDAYVQGRQATTCRCTRPLVSYLHLLHQCCVTDYGRRRQRCHPLVPRPALLKPSRWHRRSSFGSRRSLL